MEHVFVAESQRTNHKGHQISFIKGVPIPTPMTTLAPKQVQKRQKGIVGTVRNGIGVP